MLSKDKAVVVFSGGQDSTTCLFWAKKHFNEVYALSFRYGQKHEQEVELAKKIAAKAGVEFAVMDLDFINFLSPDCSLTHSDIQIDKEKPATTPPNTFVPGRNLFFLSIAAVYARNKGAMNIVTGVFLPAGMVSIVDTSMSPYKVEARVRGIGVADISRKST